MAKAKTKKRKVGKGNGAAVKHRPNWGRKLVRMKNPASDLPEFAGRTEVKKMPGGSVTLSDVRSMFPDKDGNGRSRMTIYQWRKTHGLPYIEVPTKGKAPRLRFSPKAIKAWAKQRGLPVRGAAA